MVQPAGSKVGHARSEKTRVQFDFNQESLDRLDDLVKTLDVSTRAEVIRRALSLFTTLLPELKSGSELVLRDKKGKETRVMALI